LALGWKSLYQQRNQQNEEKDTERKNEDGNKADCRPWGGGFLTVIEITSTYYIWKACFVQGLNVYSAHFFYA
jgi:hypothetical protein